MKGRPPALSPAQQDEVRRRLAVGEKATDLAAEFRVGRATIQRLSGVSGTVRKVAEQMAAAQNALEALPVAQQHAALSLAERLRKISDSMADAAVASADTARHLHVLANARAKQVKPDALGAAADDLRAVATLTKMANDAAAVPLGLMSASKGNAKLPGDVEDDDLPTVVELVGPPDAARATADPA